jgi:hypothetical protein
MIKAELSEVQRTEAIDQSSGALHLQFNFRYFSTDVTPLCGFLPQIFMRLPGAPGLMSIEKQAITGTNSRSSAYFEIRCSVFGVRYSVFNIPPIVSLKVTAT